MAKCLSDAISCDRRKHVSAYARGLSNLIASSSGPKESRSVSKPSDALSVSDKAAGLFEYDPSLAKMSPLL